MPHRLFRSTLFGITIAATGGLPAVLSAQTYTFSSCSTLGVCGAVEAVLSGSLLKVRLANKDNTLGSALFSAQLIFASALASATPGLAYQTPATAALIGTVISIGTTSPSGWFYDGVGGSNELDLTSFFNVDIEGTAASPFRAAPGDVDDGTWVTSDGFVEFSADLRSVSGVAGGQIVALGFCTDQSCAVTPEPSTLTLLATAFAGLAIVRRRRSSRLM
jgi:hypothetical protein